MRATAPGFLRTAGVVAVVLLAAGCGAKTGLNVPDAEIDASTMPDSGVPCFEVPPDGGPIDIPLETVAEIGRADVVYLIDTTASMMDEIARIRDRLRDRQVPAIENEIPDVRFAVATFADFPVEPYGSRDEDSPFTLMLPITDDLARAQAAVNVIELGDGRDEPESQVEALYQLATGEGLGSFVPASAGCPAGGLGYACLRRDALPIVLLFTDAPFHNGPDRSNQYTSVISPAPHQYSDAVAELNALDVRVIGFDSGGGQATRHLEQLATDTGAVNEGRPLVYDIGARGERLTNQVVDAIRTFAGSVIFDIDAVLEDPEPGDGVDVVMLVDSLSPLRAEPMSGVAAIDREAGVFRGVVAGTTVYWRLTIHNDVVAPGPEPQSFLLEIIFRGDGRTRIGRRLIEIVIPGTDGAGCGEL